MIGFGIDLAGYTTGKTSLAVVEVQGPNATATLLRDSSLSKVRKTSDLIEIAVVEDAAVLQRCLDIGAVAVDVPIDLQGLPDRPNPTKIWELTRRPIDRVVRAMPPLADRIGAPVARFAAVMCKGSFKPMLGERLFETYPSEIWRRLKIKAGPYKGSAGGPALISLCKTLKIDPHAENDDDVDAIICAIAASAPPSHVCDNRDFEGVEGAMPKGFRILKTLSFDRIQLKELNFNEWVRAHEGGR